MPDEYTSALTDELLEVGGACRADDGRGHTGLREHPRERDLRHLHALLLCELFHAVMQRGGGQKAHPGRAARYAPVDDLQVALSLVSGHAPIRGRVRNKGGCKHRGTGECTY